MKRARVGSAAERITQAAVDSSATKLIPAESILCVIRSGILQHTFPVALAECDVTINQDMRALTAHGGIDPDYVRFFLMARNRDILHTTAKDGTTVASIEMNRLERYAVPIAPEREQRRIVRAITDQFTDLDTAEAALGRAREGVEQFCASLLHAACTGALTAAWREANPPTETGADLLRRILAERRATWERTEHARLTAKGTPPKGDAWKARYVEPVAPEISVLPDLPVGWVWASLGQLTSKITSGSRDWGDHYADDGAVLVRAQNIKTDRLVTDGLAHVAPPGTLGEARTGVRLNDLLITITGANVTKSALVHLDLGEAYVSQHVGLCRPVFADMAHYLHLVIVSDSVGRRQLLEAAYGAGKPGLNLQDLASVCVPLPPIAEQQWIVAEARDLIASANPVARTGAEQSAALRQSILHAAFTGRLVAQDSADEPAAALLARLRAAPPPARRTRSGQRASRV
jgi:type I restriction enzyme S subunit